MPVAFSLGAVPPPQAVKLHTLLDMRGRIPTNVYVTGGQVHHVNLLDELLLEAGAFLPARPLLCGLRSPPLFTQACAFFITRAKKNTQSYRCSSRPVERSSGVRCDQTILLTGVRTAQRYPDPLPRVAYFDAVKEMRLTFLTNNFVLPALTIAQLYRARWEVGLFFRWIKQHLRIRAFLRYLRGCGEDASLGCPLGVCRGGHRREATEP